MPAKISIPPLEELPAKWGRAWEEAGTYRFDRTRRREEIFAIDTPPPTVSGALHVGHLFSYTHTDVIARYKRMKGLEVFYPIGWDDNGLATERRVQNHYGVRCDPSLPYDPDLQVEPAPDEARPVSRPNFVELCSHLTTEDEKVFEGLWRTLGLSVDWSMTYETIGERARSISQRSFLGLLEKGLAYTREAPTLWDVDFRTAVAQAEVEDREVRGTYHRIGFGAAAGGDLVIETSRPELIPACVALVAHPTDERYTRYFGTDAVSPLFGVRVPILPHELAEPEAGTGLAMVCTFGDLNDVTWWRELELPARPVIGADGKLREVSWGGDEWPSEDPAKARAAYAELEGLGAKRARSRIVELLAESGSLLGEPRPVEHSVKFYEKGDRPLKILTSRQWFVRTLDFQEDLIGRGRELNWHPPHMRARFENWVNGLNQDWAMSRQRFFGVPFPIWYRLDEQGGVRYDDVLTPGAGDLPVDPTTDVPAGFDPAQRDQPGGFTADADVMDTWATSSLTPQIISGLGEDPDLFSRVFPTDLRPQGHDIIRTWLFYSILRSHIEQDCLPWTDAAISGWVVDPNRKKMSKSKGNAVTPGSVLEEFGSDAARYWAASGAIGADTAFDTSQMRIGRRLAIKILNASRFVVEFGEPGMDEPSDPVDLAMIADLAGVVARATEMLERYEHSRALKIVERSFWSFCSNYLELVKSRAYGDGESPAAQESAVAGLRVSLSVHLRLLAPFLPFVTEEVWSWWQPGSVHRAAWPVAAELPGPADPPSPALADTFVVLEAIRKAKSSAKRPMRAPVQEVRIEGPEARLDSLRSSLGDLRHAGNVAEWSLVPTGDSDLSVAVALAEEAPLPQGDQH